MTDTDGNNDRLTRTDDALLAVDGEVRFAGGDDEALLLVRVEMLGDRAAGHAAPVEANEVLTAVLGSRGDLDPLARCRVCELAKSGRVGDGHDLPAPPLRSRYQLTVAVIAA